MDVFATRTSYASRSGESAHVVDGGHAPSPVSGVLSLGTFSAPVARRVFRERAPAVVSGVPFTSVLVVPYVARLTLAVAPVVVPVLFPGEYEAIARVLAIFSLIAGIT